MIGKVKNNKRSDRKGGKFSFRWIGPYIVKHLSRKGLVTLENSNGVILKNKYNQIRLKPCSEGMSNNDQENTGENQSSGDVSGKEDTQNLDLWNLVPDEILETILYHVVQSSVPRWQTCKSVRETCRRWSNVIVPLEEKLLLRIHIHPSNVLPNPTFKGKVKVSVRKMISSFGVSSGICKSISQHIDDRKWKSAWLVLRPDEHSWFIYEINYEINF